MKNLNFPLLEANQIECRVGQTKKNGQAIVGCSILLYKDARCDMAILDSVVGAFNWKREHIIRENVINGQRTMVNYCKVSLYDEEKQEWVSKEDVGTESNTENAKGESSDAYKRVCVNWGIGRELYTAPFIWIKPLDGEDLHYAKFTVTQIHYDENRCIDGLEIKDSKGNVRFRSGFIKVISATDWQAIEAEILAKTTEQDMTAYWATINAMPNGAKDDCRVRDLFRSRLRAIKSNPQTEAA